MFSTSKRLLIALLLLWAAAPAYAQVSAIAELASGNAGAGGLTRNIIPSPNTTSGSLVLVITNIFDNDTITSVAGDPVASCAMVVTQQFSGAAMIEIWRCVGTGAAGVITVTWGTSASNHMWKVLEVTDANSGSNYADAMLQTSLGTTTASTTSAEAGTLSALTSGSAVVAVFGASSNTTFTPDMGWTEPASGEVNDTSPNSAMAVVWQLSASDTTPTGTWGATVTEGGLAIEIGQAGAGGGGGGGGSGLHMGVF